MLILHFYRRLVYFICLAAFADAKRLPDLISLPTSHTHTPALCLSLCLALSLSASPVQPASTALRLRSSCCACVVSKKELQTTNNVNTSSSTRPHQARLGQAHHHPAQPFLALPSPPSFPSLALLLLLWLWLWLVVAPIISFAIVDF